MTISAREYTVFSPVHYSYSHLDYFLVSGSTNSGHLEHKDPPYHGHDKVDYIGDRDHAHQPHQQLDIRDIIQHYLKAKIVLIISQEIGKYFWKQVTWQELHHVFFGRQQK